MLKHEYPLNSLCCEWMDTRNIKRFDSISFGSIMKNKITIMSYLDDSQVLTFNLSQRTSAEKYTVDNCINFAQKDQCH